MKSDEPGTDAGRRRPRVFKPDDPSLGKGTMDDGAAYETVRSGGADEETGVNAETTGDDDTTRRGRGLASVDRGIGWGGILVGALTAAATFALGLWFWRLVSVGLERDDTVGWIMRGIVAVAVLALLVLMGRELAGMLRLRRLAGLKAEIATALARGDVKAERVAAERVLALYGDRRDLAWGIDRVRTHRSDVLDPGGLMTVIERDLMREIDGQARRVITASAKRTATVTAMSPMMSLAFIYLVFEVLKLLRGLATLYGGRPGFGGSLKLGRTVVGNLIAAGGVALTDDLIGQFIGQDVLRRLSRRLGEGVFNGALVARIGVAALDVVRPIPFVEVKPVRVRDIVGELFRATQVQASSTARTPFKG